MSQQVTWIGASVGGYIVESLLGEGMYSWVYSCLGSDNHRRAIKAAKPEDIVSAGSNATIAFPTQALMQVTGSVMAVQPDAFELLSMQVKKLQAVKTPGMPRVLEALNVPGMSYYFMEIAPGKNLRKVMMDGPVKTDVLIAVAEKLQALQGDAAFDHHGDIKPENIMVDGLNIEILDPGYFGPLRTTDGAVYDMIVTTPSYYPHLAPNDNYALALMLWEIATGSHPLSTPASFPEPDKHGEKLQNYIRGAQSVGHGRFITAILSLERPSQSHPNCNPALEAFLLAAIGMEFTPDNKLELAKGHATIADTIAGLRQLRAGGLEIFSAGS